MAEPFIGQIIMVGFNFAPKSYATCDGQIMSIAQNTALFSLLGTTYGGNGQTTFALPDLRGRTPIHQGNGPGLTPRVMGEMSGEENHTLLTTEMPMHNHLASGSSADANNTSPAGNTWANEGTATTNLYVNSAPNAPMNAQAIGTSGGNQPHNNMQPYLVINFCIALQGIFPSRN